LDHGVTSGARTVRDARSPSTSTAPTGRPDSSRARSAAPAAPPLPPLVETTVSVWRAATPPKMRVNSSRTAVPDSSASAPRPAASRCATTTICSSIVPGRRAMTVRRLWRPSIVLAWRCTVRTRKLAARICAAISAAMRLSASEPGRRSAKRRDSPVPGS
jgi:hypothetical protein